MQAPAKEENVEQLAINTIRTLAIDAVQKANSGHPGAPMALAPAAYVVFHEMMRHNPANPHWANRDRFVLSNGHASMLLYSMLHLTGYDLPMEELKRFRQWGSKTPGHPEYRMTAGVETTTGPLGQGCGNSVGMAITERWLESYFNKGSEKIVDYRIYTICGDGCMMEGITHEAASLAGHLGLSNLVWIYDNNHISIEGSTELAFTEDTAERFRAYQWNVLHVKDGNDTAAIASALREAEKEKDRPTFIKLDTKIAWGSPNKVGKASAHGEPLGEEEVKLTKKAYGWPEDKFFYVPDSVRELMDDKKRGTQFENEWNAKFEAYKKSNPELAQQFEMIQKGELPPGWDKDIPTFAPDAKGVAGRDASQKVENAIAPNLPWLIGGSADLAPSTKTRMTFEGAGDFEKGNYGGRNFHFGVREHAMGATVNGMALSGVRVFGSGFLIFSDYMRTAIRLSAIMEIPVLYIFTHDSIGVGEDGPTHQPIEQIMSLRAIPHMNVLRPGDANEVAECWRSLLSINNEPHCMMLSRQPLPTLDRTKYASAEGTRKGAYILAENDPHPDVIIMGTGSELQLCVGAYEQLIAAGVKVRVVSMPCWEYFEKQPKEYKDSIFTPTVRARVAVEAGTTLGWREYVGLDGLVVGRADFGASAPIKDVMREFGFTVEHVVAAAKETMAGVKGTQK